MYLPVSLRGQQMQKKPDHSFVKGGLESKGFSQGPDRDGRVKGLHVNASLQVHLSVMMIQNNQVICQQLNGLSRV